MGLKNKSWNPLENRIYRFKKPALEFFCPLCRTQRAITIGHRLTMMNYLQIILLTAITCALSYPWGAWRGLVSFFIYLPLFEMIRRALFSREIPCPHCGFDASWYKRDVTVARARVEKFWEGKRGEMPEMDSAMPQPNESQNETAAL